MAYPVQLYATLVDAAGNSPVPQMYVAMVDPSGNYLSGPIPAQGRLTLTTAVPVLTTAAAAQATVFYTPYRGNLVPIYNGTTFTPTTFTELSNVLANSATGSAGPAAAVALAAYDIFVWNNAGTMTLSRGPAWKLTATVTMTNANPGVVTWTTHGLTTGMVVQFSTTGALPTNVVAGTNYFVTVVNANTFKLSTTLANLIALTYIDTTAGVQSGVQTGLCQGLSRGTGAGTSQLTLTTGIYLNTVAITNGPAALRGTYVGTIYTDSSGATVSYDPGSVANFGGTAKFGLWNNYNRVAQKAKVIDNVSYAYTSGTIRPADGVLTNSIQMVRGLQEDGVSVRYLANCSTLAVLAAFTATSISLDDPLTRAAGLLAFSASLGKWMNVAAAAANAISVNAFASGDPGLGAHVIYALEVGDGANANTFNAALINTLEADVMW